MTEKMHWFASILTKDYPILCQERLEGLHGIDVIERYLHHICVEQQFLHSFPENIVKRILRNYHSEYEEMMMNLCEPVLYHVLGCYLVQKNINQTDWSQRELQSIEDYVLSRSSAQRRQELLSVLEQIVSQFDSFSQNEMKEYFMYGVESFLRDIMSVVEHDCVERLFSQELSSME